MNQDRHCTGQRFALVLTTLAVCLPQLGAQEPQPADQLRAPRYNFTDQPAYEVVRVDTGNKLVVKIGNVPTRIRLIGTYVPSQGPNSDAAREFASRLLVGECVYVKYEADWPLRDRDGNRWVYAFRAPDGLFVNLELVRQGYARISAIERFEHQSLFRAYEEVARKSRKGVWAPVDRAAVASTQPAAQADRAAKPTTDDDPQQDREVVVYVTEHGRKYHCANCQYVRTGGVKITLAAARAKGHTPCKKCKPPCK